MLNENRTAMDPLMLADSRKDIPEGKNCSTTHRRTGKMNKRRVIAIIVSALMIISLLPAGAMTVYGGEELRISEDGSAVPEEKPEAENADSAQETGAGKSQDEAEKPLDSAEESPDETEDPLNNTEEFRDEAEKPLDDTEEALSDAEEFSGDREEALKDGPADPAQEEGILEEQEFPPDVYLVWFGGKIWRVIDHSRVANDDTGKYGIFLISEKVIDVKPWRSDLFEGMANLTPRKRWDNSDLRAYLRNDFEDVLTMTDTEKKAVLTAVKNDALYEDGSVNYYGCGLTGDRFFALSFNEVKEVFPEWYLRIAYPEEGGKKRNWWTRSCSSTNHVITASTDADMVILDCNSWESVRPAFYLDPAMVESVSDGNDGCKVINFKDGTSSTEKQNITITQEGEGSAGASPSIATPGTEITINAEPSEGWLFREWKVLSGGVTLANSKSPVTTFTLGRKNVEIQAVFSPITYKIIYNLDGGTNHPSNPSTYTPASEKITLAAPTKDGRIFAGWYDGTGRPVSVIPKGSIGDLTLFAFWTWENAGFRPGVSMETSLLLCSANQGSGVQKIWYGGSQWDVVAYDRIGNQALARNGAVTLLGTDIAGGQDKFGGSNKYGESLVKEKLEAFLNGSFSSEERAAIMTRVLKCGSSRFGEEGYDPSKIRGDADITAAVWTLSATEAKELPDEIRARGSWSWFLRSPGGTYPVNNGNLADRAAVVYKDGHLDEIGYAVTAWPGHCARAACDLDLSRIILLSAAEGGKTVDDYGLREVGGNDSGEWKATIYDDARNGFSAEFLKQEGSRVTVRYSGAKTGGNEYLSALIRDKSGRITYYGKITALIGANGTGIVDISGKLYSGDTLYIFNEQDNGDKKTDYSGRLVAISGITPEKPIPVTGLTLNKSTMEIAAESSEKLTVRYAPANTTEKKITWSSSAPKIAAVDENGNVTGLSQGTATITATSKSNSMIKAACKVNVLFKDVTDPKKAVYKAVYDLAGKGVVKGYGS